MRAVDKLMNYGISRRGLLLGAAGFGMTSLCSAKAYSATTTTVTQFIWTGAQELVPRRIARQYSAQQPEANINIIAGTNSEIYPKLALSRAIDPDSPLINFGFFNLDASERGKLAGLWSPIEQAQVPEIAHIRPEYRQKDGLGAIFCMDAGGLVYNTTAFGNTPPDSWEAIFDPALKGKIALFDNFWAGNGLVALAKLHGGSEDDIEPAIALYEKAARDGQFHSFVTSNAQLQQLLVSGDVVLAPHFRGIALPWAKAGAPIAYAVPKEGQVAFPEGFQLVNGSTEAQLSIARQIISQSLQANNVLDYCLTACVIPLTDNVTLPPEIASDPAISPQAIQNAIHLDYAKIAANSAKWTELWNTRVKANL